MERLFTDADKLGGFKLFFSFDHGPGVLTDPSQYADYVIKYMKRPSYYYYNGKALVSTFGGEKVTNDQWSAFKKTTKNVLVVPGFYDGQPKANVFDTRASLDGVFNWNSWPTSSAGKVISPTTSDVTAQTAARNAGKLFMMGISPVQFKHIDTTQNWYRRGEDNLEYRFAQALELQPDMLQLQTWNDAGESHYMGNLWPEPMTNSAQIRALVDGYDHKGYQQVIPSFIKAWKRGDKTTANMVPTNGKSVQGVFWHHTLTVGATCGGTGPDQLPKPKDITNNAEDAVSGIVLVAKGQAGLVAVVNVGTKELGKITLVEGYNKFKFLKLTPGKVQLEVWSGSSLVAGGYGSIAVSLLHDVGVFGD